MITVSPGISTLLSVSSMSLILTIQLLLIHDLQKKSILIQSLITLILIGFVNYFFQDFSLIPFILLQLLLFIKLKNSKIRYLSLFLLTILVTLLTSLPVSAILILLKRSLKEYISRPAMITVWDALLCILLQWVSMLGLLYFFRHQRKTIDYFRTQNTKYSWAIFSTLTFFIAFYIAGYSIVNLSLAARRAQSTWIIPILVVNLIFLLVSTIASFGMIRGLIASYESRQAKGMMQRLNAYLLDLERIDTEMSGYLQAYGTALDKLSEHQLSPNDYIIQMRNLKDRQIKTITRLGFEKKILSTLEQIQDTRLKALLFSKILEYENLGINCELIISNTNEPVFWSAGSLKKVGQQLDSVMERMLSDTASIHLRIQVDEYQHQIQTECVV